MVTAEFAASRVAVHGQISDVLKDHPDGLHVSEISSRTGMESGKITRVLRTLATKHIYKEGDA